VKSFVSVPPRRSAEERSVTGERHGEFVPAPEVDASTRSRVAASILEHGPSTAAELAERLDMTAAGIRRHLDALCEAGLVEPRERRVYGARGRGRPAKVFVLTDAGRGEFPTSYDDVALAALRYLENVAGPDAVEGFAAGRTADLERRYVELSETHRTDPDAPTPTGLLAQALSESGYVASIKPAVAGEQLCQHHCPVAHVAEEFPQLCQAETDAFARLLGRHVQRLATIAHGDGVCTTYVPDPERAVTHGPAPGARSSALDTPSTRTSSTSPAMEARTTR